MNLVPVKIQPYFEMKSQTMDGDNRLIEGTLKCCYDSDFEVFFAGEIKCGFFSKMFLTSENDNIAVKARCKKCGRTISVFNSSIDGYEHCEEKQNSICLSTRALICKKCHDNSYSVSIKYEYPDEQELRDLEISDIDNAFSWIWITLECNNCGTKYKNIVDCETT
jgi:hypothetical protein